MEDLDDEVDLRHHKGLNPDVYYRCPTLESLEGALRDEVDKNAASLIPTLTVTVFVFAAASTITIPVIHQQNLDTLIQPADYTQSIAVEHTLCHEIDGKERLKVQRAVARSIIAAIQETDGFAYTERSAKYKEGGDGTRFKYICLDSLQNRHRRNNMKKEKPLDSVSSGIDARKEPALLPTYDCEGAVHIKFSLDREAINVVYKHIPIHAPRHDGDSLPPLATDDGDVPAIDAASEKNARKRKRGKKDDAQVQDQSVDVNLDMSTSPEAPKQSAKTTRKKKAALESPKKNKKARLPASPTKSRKKVPVGTEPPPIACIRCRQKKIKCNQAKPMCNQCHRGLWTCEYEVVGIKMRTKNGCLNCKQRKRKCTEEKPSCAHCLRLNDDCAYADYS